MKSKIILKVEPKKMAERSIADSKAKREAREKRLAVRFWKGSRERMMTSYSYKDLLKKNERLIAQRK